MAPSAPNAPRTPSPTVPPTEEFIPESPEQPWIYHHRALRARGLSGEAMYRILDPRASAPSKRLPNRTLSPPLAPGKRPRGPIDTPPTSTNSSPQQPEKKKARLWERIGRRLPFGKTSKGETSISTPGPLLGETILAPEGSSASSPQALEVPRRASVLKVSDSLHASPI